MNFIYPEFLYALAFLALPIIIHLFNFKRYKTLYFSDVRFLKEVKQRSQSSSKLKHLLVLISRLLLISALVFAFAQPYWKEDGEVKLEGKTGVQLYVDNSFSMQSAAEQGILLDKAKQRAYTIINSYGISDRFQLLNNAFENNPSRWLNRQEAIEKIQEIEINSQNRKLSEIMARFQEADQASVQQGQIYLISDFQKNNFDLESTDSLSSGLNLVFLDAKENDNISLDALAFEKPFHLPEQLENIKAKVKKHGESDKEKIPMRLIVDDQLKAPLSLDFGMEDSLEATLTFQSGQENQQSGYLMIKDYPVTFDDTLYFNYELKREIKMIHLYMENANSSLKALYSEDSLFDYHAVPLGQINYSNLEQSDLILLDELSEYSSGLIAALNKFLENGGHMVFIPPATPDLSPSVNQMLREINGGQLLDLQDDIEMKVSKINEKALLYEGVFESIPENLDLPFVKQYWLSSQNSRAIREDLILLKNGSTFLSRVNKGKGNSYIFHAPLNDSATTFGRHALFVPTLYNIALYAQEKKALYYSLNDDYISLSDIEPLESPIHLIGKGIDLIPKQEFRNGKLRIFIKGKLNQAGHYQMFRDGEQIGMISLNYGREESDYELLSETEIEAYANERSLTYKKFDEENEGLSQAIQSAEKGYSLWKYFIILALIFMGVEILLLRLFK